MTRAELVSLLDAAAGLRIAVVGDYCLDAYWTIDDRRSERSVETGLATRPVRTQRYALGGAGNVATNLRALGVGRVEAFGVVGDDPFGVQLRALLRAGGTVDEGLLCQSADWETHVYVKPLRDGVEEHRLDFGNFNRLDNRRADALLARLAEGAPSYDAIVLNEQVQAGILHCERFRHGLAGLVDAYPSTPFLLDSRHCSDAVDGAIRKLNHHEALRLCGGARAADEPVSRDEARQAAETLRERWRRPVFVSRGARGCLVCDDEGLYEMPGIRVAGPTDAVGAGDSLLAGIALALAAGRDPLTAAALGNLVAGVTVQKLFQTGTATPAEILALFGCDATH